MSGRISGAVESLFRRGLIFVRTFSGAAAVLLSIACLPFTAFSQSRTLNASIDVSKTGTPISSYIYGQFLEHGGDIVNTGIWSEMLVDRKFFYPVDTAAPVPL
jgi:alpha-L-arabinofuranosidase